MEFATVNRWENGKNSPDRMDKKALFDFYKAKGLDEELIKYLLVY